MRGVGTKLLRAFCWGSSDKTPCLPVERMEVGEDLGACSGLDAS